LQWQPFRAILHERGVDLLDGGALLILLPITTSILLVQTTCIPIEVQDAATLTVLPVAPTSRTIDIHITELHVGADFHAVAHA
jgi:hypothetical protein